MARILVVEDSGDNASLLRTYLEGLGHSVETAGDGGEAMLKLGTFAPDVLILDLMLPLINGWELLGAKSRAPEVKAIPVILCTAWAGVGDIPEGQVAGLLQKPYELWQLGALLDQVLGGGV